MACQLVEQFILLGGEITLIKVIADDERLKRHTLKLRVHCTVRANFSEPYGHGRQRVNPIKRGNGGVDLRSK
ncbi:MAG: hypothetical protein II559_06865 [Muribaculaceae bacterium]|nr:hypothetical protein [Muribaculaceae bacterium]MBQ5408313.1 hypothetical protein [Muribaculaceae bacterium]